VTVIEKKLVKEEEEKAYARGVLMEFQSLRGFEGGSNKRGVETFLSSNNIGVYLLEAVRRSLR